MAVPLRFPVRNNCSSEELFRLIAGRLSEAKELELDPNDVLEAFVEHSPLDWSSRNLELFLGLYIAARTNASARFLG